MEEFDVFGEYYIDCVVGKLYFIFNVVFIFGCGVVMVMMFDELMLCVDGVLYVNFDDFVMEYGWVIVVVIFGGLYVMILYSDICNFIDGGVFINLFGCYMYDGILVNCGGCDYVVIDSWFMYVGGVGVVF